MWMDGFNKKHKPLIKNLGTHSRSFFKKDF